jgi:hypothetical protein
VNTFHIAPHEQNMNPQDPTTSEYGQGWMANSVAYILFKDSRTRPTRVVISFGEVGVSLLDVVEVRDDQSGRLLGNYRIAGIVHYDSQGFVAYDEGEFGGFYRTLTTGSMK